MNAETLWILKKVAAQEISAQFADRLLRALEILREIEESESVDNPATGEQSPTSESEKHMADNVVAETAGETVVKTAEDFTFASTVWPKTSNEKPLLDPDGIGIIGNVPDGTQLLLEKAGNITIQGWDETHLRAESKPKGNTSLSTVLNTGKNLKIWSDNGIALYIPPAVSEINIANGSGSIDITKYPNDIVIDSDIGEINISEASGSIKVNSFEGGIALEDCGGKMFLESSLGDITVRKASSEQNAFPDLSEETEEDILVAANVAIESGSGDIFLSDIDNDIAVRSSSGNMTLERLSGKISVESKNTRILLRDSGTADIHIESDGGDINLENCCANVRIESGDGDILMSSGSPAPGEMGKVELKMRTGDARLHQKAFGNLHVVIENGNAEVTMEKLHPGGSGQISVHKGDVTIGVLPSFGCELIVHGSRENMHIELPVEIVEKSKSRLRGIVNGGGPKMEVIAPNGTVRFQALKLSHISGNAEDFANKL